jgi:S-DNA-T family DNA segregation ATPase FtsK/SpoIIIE
MATSTRSTARGKTTTPRGRSTPARTTTTKNAPTKKLPASRAKAKPVPTDQPGLLTVAWLGLAHVVGGAARLFGKESLAKDERRDGVPFFIFLLAIAGAVVEWFNSTDPVAIALDSYTFGLLFGRLAFALPVIMVLFAVWLFRHPASVNDNGRIGIGLGILLISVSALCHIFGGAPAATDGPEALSAAGGLLGWVLGAPLLFATVWVATPIVSVLLLLSLFIITKTPPNRVGNRLRELYSYLFGAQLEEREPKFVEKPAKNAKQSMDETGDLPISSLDDYEVDEDPSSLPWWRRNKAKSDVERLARRRPRAADRGHREHTSRARSQRVRCRAHRGSPQGRRRGQALHRRGRSGGYQSARGRSRNSSRFLHNREREGRRRRVRCPRIQR